MIKQQKKGILKIQEHNFDSKIEYKQFLSNQSLQTQANQKELSLAKGPSNTKSQQNLQQKNLIKISNFSQLDEFKRIVLKHFTIEFKDEILEQTNDIQQQTNDTQQKNTLFRKNHNIKYFRDKKNKNFNIKPNINFKTRNEILKNQSKLTQDNKKVNSKVKLIQIKQIESQTIDQQEEIEKNIKKEKDQANLNIEMKKNESQRILFEQKMLRIISYNFKQTIEALKQEQLQNQNDYNIQIEQASKRIQVAENQIIKITSNLKALDQDQNDKVKQQQEQNKKAYIIKQNKNIYKTQSEVVSRKQKFLSINQSQINPQQQSQSLLQNFEEENCKKTQIMQPQQQEYIIKRDQYQNQISQLNSISQNYRKNIELYQIEQQKRDSQLKQQIEKKTLEENEITASLLKLDKLEFENQEKFQQQQQEIQDKIQELENQNAEVRKILNQLAQQKQIYNQFQDEVLYPIRTEYQQEIAQLQDLPQNQQFDSLNQVESPSYLDEIFHQEQRIMILQYQSIRYLKDNNWEKITYTPKWQNKDKEDKKNNLQNGELTQNVLKLELTEQQVNAYAEYLQNRDEKYYFTGF